MTNGLIEEVSLADYLEAIENCPDEFVEREYEKNGVLKKNELPRLERDFGLQDNYNMYLEGDRVDFLKYLVHSGKYNFKRGGHLVTHHGTEFYTFKWKAAPYSNREEEWLLYPRFGPSDLVVDDFRTKLLYVNEVLKGLGLPFDEKENERHYNIGLQLHGASVGVLKHIGEYIIKNNLESLNDGHASYYGRKVAVTNHRKNLPLKIIYL